MNRGLRRRRTDAAAGPADGRGDRRGVAKALTEARLEAAALHYLQRYAASVDRVRRVLQRRVWRAERLDDGDLDREGGMAMVERVVGRLRERELLDDGAYAETKAHALHNRGASLRSIRGRLGQDGIDAESIESAVERIAEHGAEPDRRAAIALARRRRLGPFRPAAERPDRRERDLAALARAGFAYDIARTVVDAATVDDLKDDALL